jgi:hypothetical protein
VLTAAKIITQAQVTEESDQEREIHFGNWFLWTILDSVLAPKLTLFTDEAWFHLSGESVLKTISTGVILI